MYPCYIDVGAKVYTVYQRMNAYCREIGNHGNSMLAMSILTVQLKETLVNSPRMLVYCLGPPCTGSLGFRV